MTPKEASKLHDTAAALRSLTIKISEHLDVVDQAGSEMLFGLSVAAERLAADHEREIWDLVEESQFDRIRIEVDPSAHHALAALAEASGRSIEAQASHLLDQALSNQGHVLRKEGAA